jgi:hypothetical protein
MKKFLIGIYIFSGSFILNAQPFSLDNTFSSFFNFNSSSGGAQIISSIYEQQNGYVLAAGSFYSTGQGCCIVRLMQNGFQDPSFSINGNPTNDYYIDTIFDGNFIYYLYDWWGKLNNSGAVVDTAWSNRVNLFDPCTKMEPFILADGRIFAGRYPCPHDTIPEMVRYIVRILQDGSIDTSFHHNTNAFVVRLFRYDASHLLVHSYSMTMYDSIPVDKLCRIDTAGNLDTTFHSIFSGWGVIRNCYTQADGKIVVGGAFHIQNYPDTLNLIRLNVDGSLDSAFNNFNNINNDVYAYKQIITICPTSDAGYLVGGQFIGYQSYNRNFIAKTDSNGYVDTAYLAGQGITGTVDGSQPMVNRIKKSSQADKYYVAGRFTTFNGQSVQPLIRLNGLSITGVEELDNDRIALSVYPNPVDATANLFLSISPKEKTLLQIFDVSGEILAEQNITDNNITLNTTAFANGVYWCRIVSEKKNSTAVKFVVMH